MVFRRPTLARKAPMTDTHTILFRISEDGEDYTWTDMREANLEDAELLARLANVTPALAPGTKEAPKYCAQAAVRVNHSALIFAVFPAMLLFIQHSRSWKILC
jgi:hypothetical protein